MTLTRIERGAWVVLTVFAVLHVISYAIGAWGIERVVDLQSALARVRVGVDVVVVAALLFHAGRAVGPLVRGDADGAFGEGRTRLWWVARVSAGVALAFMLLHVWDQRLRLGVRAPSGHVFVQELAARASSTVAGVGWAALVMVTGTVATGAYLGLGWLSRAHAREPLAADRHRRKNVQIACIALGVAIALAGALGTLSFATGLRFGAPRQLQMAPLAPCPAP